MQFCIIVAQLVNAKLHYVCILMKPIGLIVISNRIYKKGYLRRLGVKAPRYVVHYTGQLNLDQGLAPVCDRARNTT